MDRFRGKHGRSCDREHQTDTDPFSSLPCTLRCYLYCNNGIIPLATRPFFVTVVLSSLRFVATWRETESSRVEAQAGDNGHDQSEREKHTNHTYPPMDLERTGVESESRSSEAPGDVPRQQQHQHDH